MWSLIVHGGAGAIDARASSAHQAGCRRAAEAGAELLSRGGAALDAVVAAVRVLEDDPVFNAGTGGALDERGVVACDAAVMTGALDYGAVGAVSGVRHPVELARKVMEDGRHSLLVGPGAIAFARAHGVPLCDPAALAVDPSRSRWWFTAAGDTVGACARDADGRVAAATSTGGLLDKYWGRIGDSPLAGAGTYARDDLGAISATGHGETIMKVVLAYQALLGLVDADKPSERLAAELERAYARLQGRGGLIAVLPDGRTAFANNTPHMGVAWIGEGVPLVSRF